MVRRRSPLVLVAAALALVSCSSGKGGSSSGNTTARSTVRAGTSAVTHPGGATEPTITSPIPTAGASASTQLLQPGQTSNTVGGPRVACRVKVTGAITSEFTAYDDKSAFSSDYYLSTADIVKAANPSGPTYAGVSTVPGEESDLANGPGADGTAPLTSWFLLNCQGGDITLSLFTNPASTSRDVPFKAGRYTVAEGSSGGDDATQFVVNASFYGDPTQMWEAGKGGYIQLDRFDQRGAAGAFHVVMRNVTPDGSAPTKSLVFDGTFAVTCKTGSKCQK